MKPIRSTEVFTTAACFRQRVNLPAAQVAGLTDEELASEGIAAFKAFIKECGVPTTLGEKGVTAADIPGIVEGVRTVSFNADGVLASNPPVTAEALAQILTAAL